MPGASEPARQLQTVTYQSTMGLKTCSSGLIRQKVRNRMVTFAPRGNTDREHMVGWVNCIENPAAEAADLK